MSVVGEKRGRIDLQEGLSPGGTHNKRARQAAGVSEDVAISAIGCVVRCGFGLDAIAALRSCKSVYEDADLWRVAHRAWGKGSMLQMAASSGNPRRVKWVLDQRFLCSKEDYDRAVLAAFDAPCGDERSELISSVLSLDNEDGRQVFPDAMLPRLLSNESLNSLALRILASKTVGTALWLRPLFPAIVDMANDSTRSGEQLALFFAKADPPGVDTAALMRAAVKRGWETVVLALLGAGEDPGAALPPGREPRNGPSLLAEAAAAGHCKIMSLLLDAGADINDGGRVAGTNMPAPSPIASAARSGRVQAVRLLLDRDCRFDQKALVEACAQGHAEIVSALCSKWDTCEPGIPDHSFYCSLLEACSWAHASLALQLIDRGALGPAGASAINRLTSAFRRACTTARSGQEAHELPLKLLDKASAIGIDTQVAAQNCSAELLLAVRKRQDKLALKLIDCGPPRSLLYGDMPTLEAAIEAGSAVVLKRILDLDITAYSGVIDGPNGVQLLQRALNSGFDDIGVMLLLHGVDLLQRALYTACAQRMPKTALKLMDLGADLESATSTTNSVIHAACHTGLASVVSRLIKECPSLVHARDSLFALPLQVASSAGHTAVIKVLIDEGGADVDAGLAKSTLLYVGLTPLYHAVSGGHVEASKALLERGASSRLKTLKGLSAITAAASAGHAELVSMLIVRPGTIAILNNRGTDGPTALTSAVEGRHSAAVKHLLTVKGADPDMRFASGKEPCLQRALRTGDEETMRHLLEAGAEPDLRDSSGRNAAHIAAELCLPSAMPLLAKWDADLEAWDAKGRTPLIIASSHGHTAVVESLCSLPGVNCNARGWYDMTALMHAATAGHVDAVKALIAAGADLDAENSGGSALIKAIQGKHVGAALALIEAGASVILHDFDDCSPLYLACKLELVTVAQAIILRDADVLAEDEYGDRAVHFCFGKPALVPVALWLVEKGENADVQSRKKDGPRRTLLGDVITLSARDAVNGSSGGGMMIAYARRLIALGANVNGAAGDEESPLTLACKQRSPALAMLLLENGADVRKDGNDLLLLACTNGLADVALELMRRGAYAASVHQSAGGGNANILAAAVKAGPQMGAVVKCLVELGAEGDPSSLFAFTMQKGWFETAQVFLARGVAFDAKHVRLAVFGKATNLVSVMLLAGLDPNAPDSSGFLPLHRACDMGDLPMVKLLLANKADPNLQDRREVTAGIIAAILAPSNCVADILAELIERGADMQAMGGWVNFLSNLLNRDDDTAVKPVVALMAKLGIKLSSEEWWDVLDRACRHHKPAAVKALLEAGADPNAKNSIDIPPMHYVAFSNADEDEESDDDEEEDSYDDVAALETLKVLLKAGANVNATGAEDCTLLHRAAGLGRDLIVSALLQVVGLDLDAMEEDGYTALHMAAAGGEKKILELLLRAGADASLKNDAGLTALELAQQCADHSTSDIVALFERAARRDAAAGLAL